MDAEKGFPKWFFPVVLVFVVATGISCISQYSKIFKKNNADIKGKDLKTAAFFIADQIEADPHFTDLISYVNANHNDLMIPADYKTDLTGSESAFNSYMDEHYNEDEIFLFENNKMSLNELDSEAQKLYAKYRMEYWYNTFAENKEKYNLSELSFCYPLEGKENTVIVIIDPGKNEIGDAFLNLCQEKYLDPKENEILWKTWEAGTSMDKYDETNGMAYTNIVLSNDEKAGLIHAVR